MPILILSEADDDHGQYMHEHLESLGHDVVLFDARLFPKGLLLTYEPRSSGGLLHAPGARRIALADLTSVYWRSYGEPEADDMGDAEATYIAQNDSRALVESLFLRVNARWVNGFDAFRLHQTKPAALSMVAQAGVPTPATLLTNDPDEVLRFVKVHPRCIHKPVQGGSHTRRLTAEHLTDEHLERLALAPITLQEEVPGTNIRVFIAGERTFAAEIRTDAIDFRDDESAAVLATTVPPSVEAFCRTAAELLKLKWTGIDLRRTPEGRYVFLEANPSPMFITFERLSGLPLTDALTALLV